MTAERLEQLAAALPPDATVTSLDPLPSDPDHRRIRVAGRVLATLPAADIDRLGIEVGRSWTAAMTADVRDALQLAATRREALRILGRRDLSRGELIRRLRRKGYPDSMAGTIADECAERGWVDDQAYAESVCRRALERGPMPAAALAARLRAKHVDADTADRVSRYSTAEIDLLEAAVQLGRRRLSTMARLPAATAVRRVATALARRGFDDETVGAALERLGLDPSGSNEEHPYGT